MPLTSVQEVMQKAKAAFDERDYDRALALAKQALSFTRKGATGEYVCREFMARCMEKKGAPREALRLYKENAERGCDLPDTYSRLAFLGERCGDIEAVRIGSKWLQEFAHQFGLIDKKEQRRLQRVEKRFARGAFTPRTDTATEGTSSPRTNQTSPGCGVLVLALLCGMAIGAMLSLI